METEELIKCLHIEIRKGLLGKIKNLSRQPVCGLGLYR